MRNLSKEQPPYYLPKSREVQFEISVDGVNFTPYEIIDRSGENTCNNTFTSPIEDAIIIPESTGNLIAEGAVNTLYFVLYIGQQTIVYSLVFVGGAARLIYELIHFVIIEGLSSIVRGIKMRRKCRQYLNRDLPHTSRRSREGININVVTGDNSTNDININVH